MLHRDLESLTPETRQMFREFLRKCQYEGLSVSATETKRDIETQAVYFLRGRIPDDEKNIQLLQDLGEKFAWRFSEEECKKTVTWTLASNHLDGTAIDIAVIVNGHVSWDFDGPEWTRAIEIAREVGFECGSDWENPDYPHLQNTGERS